MLLQETQLLVPQCCVISVITIREVDGEGLEHWTSKLRLKDLFDTEQSQGPELGEVTPDLRGRHREYVWPIPSMARICDEQKQGIENVERPLKQGVLDKLRDGAVIRVVVV